VVEISGPRGSLIISDDFDWWLLIGDETALPSIARRVEGLAAGVHAITLVAVAGAAEE
jgi:NADPH-dependent ferric siderophore reductase